MISLAILRLEVGENIFKRGEDIYKDKNLSREKTTFIIVGNKLVAKSKIKDYNLKIEFSILNGHILTNDCTCPYYDNTHNKCKHIIALAHQINNILETTIPQIVYEKPENKVKLVKENITKLNNLDTSQSNTDKHIQNVTQLTKKIKNLLEKNSELNNLEVKGEISTFSPNRSGHIYFSIKDDGAILKCVMFKWDAQNNLDFNPKTGDKVILTGSIKLYEPSGSYQLIVKKMKIAGQGDLFAKFLKLKKKLEEEGLFSQDKKLQIPKIPKTIGIISSPTGAVIQDIINTIKRRFPALKLLLIPVPVQGAGSETKIIQAIKDLNNKKEVDTIIIARGGGSIEDLWCFNDETLARTIFDSKKPIISAIGHETDFTICDFVADQRAPTPTAAAEIATPTLLELNLFLDQVQNRIKLSIKNNLEMKKLYLINSQNSIFSLIDKKLQTQKHNLMSFKEKLTLLSAKNILSKGYSITTDEKNKIIKDITKLKSNQKITTVLSNGKVISNIEKIKINSNKK